MSGLELESRLSWVGITAVVLSALALTAGLGFHVADDHAALSVTLLQAGLIILMATPILRVLISTAERTRRRDWTFVVVTVVVLAELTLAAWFAGQRV